MKISNLMYQIKIDKSNKSAVFGKKKGAKFLPLFSILIFIRLKPHPQTQIQTAKSLSIGYYIISKYLPVIKERIKH